MNYTERQEPVITDLVVTLDEIKQHLIVDHDDDDVLITRYVLAALAHAEAYCDRSFRVRRHQVIGDGWPCDGMLLQYGPVRRIDEVTYYDTDGAQQTLDASLWRILPTRHGHRLVFYSTPPSVECRPDAVSINYLAGYGALPGASPDSQGLPYTLPIVLGGDDGARLDVNARLPDNVKHAVYMLVGHWYENRETVIAGTISSPVAIAAEALLDLERVRGV